MPEKIPESVAVIFRKGDYFLVPPEPLALPYEDRYEREAFESAAYRLAADHGVMRAKVDATLIVPPMDDAPHRAFLLTDTVGILDSSEYYTHRDDLVEHVGQHRTLRPVDVALFEQAWKMHGIQRSSRSSRTLV